MSIYRFRYGQEDTSMATEDFRSQLHALVTDRQFLVAASFISNQNAQQNSSVHLFQKPRCRPSMSSDMRAGRCVQVRVHLIHLYMHAPVTVNGPHRDTPCLPCRPCV